MTLSPRSPLLLLTLLFGCGLDLTPMLGTYHGDIVADAIVATNYPVTVAQVDKDTISISGADFSTFEVDMMKVGDLLTNLPDDPENTLSFSGGTISVAHEGSDGSVTFTGALDGASGDDGSGDDGSEDDGSGDDGSGEDTGDGGDTGGGDSAASIAEGDYQGSITGPVLSVDYTLTLTFVDSETVEASGAGISPFEVPLRIVGDEVEEAGTWEDGAFQLSNGDLSLTYDPTDLVFTGSRI